MNLKSQQYWAIIITLLFHAMVFWLLFFAEMNRFAENNTYEIELNPAIQEDVEEQEQAKIKEAAGAELREILTSKAAKRIVSGEQWQEEQASSEQLQEEFEKKQKQTQQVVKLRAKAQINLAKEKQQNESESEEEKVPQTVFYVGKSRVEYFLAQRYRVKLPIPVYKCEGGGTVEVAISVNRKGMVTDAGIIKDRSRSASDCMKEAALNAALTSVFSERAAALITQKGRIVYQFAAQ